MVVVVATKAIEIVLRSAPSSEAKVRSLTLCWSEATEVIMELTAVVDTQVEQRMLLPWAMLCQTTH